MTNYSTLVEELHQHLKPFEYVLDTDHVIPNALYISYIRDHGIFMVRNVCAVLDIPDNLVRTEPLKRYFNYIRKNLLHEYGEAFIWKELEFCLVGICSSKAFQEIKECEAKLVETVSFSFNSMLGCCFIDRSNLDLYVHSTWGLFFSGTHFKTVRKAVEEWCEKEKAGLNSGNSTSVGS